ncbi:hypothetical protein KP509_36G048400 [Ceratopteris richardii]|nr:hypothetical protein KP509_36G048400 [Ceratopteris richardii]
MAKALKGMSVSRTTSLVEQISGVFLPSEVLPLSENRADSMKLSPSVIQSNKLPLDLSLKTSVRFTSDASFERCERITNQDLYVGMKNFLIMSRGQEPCTAQNNMEVANMSQNKVEVSFAEALHSWIYPQSVLPSSVLSALASAAAHGSSSEEEFLSKRQLAWEDSFRSLYYIFRNGQCDLFYFSTQQFLAMFISGGILKKNKNEISAYISRSTRGLRALFQEQDISFSMPLCVTKVDTSVEEIQELTEFEKSHPGQTRLVDSMAAVDNSPQSLLVFSGQKSVHGLYDFLLNHRSLLSSTTGADVPVLYSPTPFQNASLVMPEVVCKKLHTPGDGIANEHSKQYTMNARHSLEVRGGVLPPWVVWRVCRVVQQLQHGKWEASFASDPLTGGFNIAQMYGVTEGQEEETVKGSFLRQELNDSVILSPEMRTGFVKELKMDEGSYAVTLSVV